MKKKQALKDALALVHEIQAGLHGPAFPGRAHKLKAEQLPRLVEILKEGLDDGE